MIYNLEPHITSRFALPQEGGTVSIGGPSPTRESVLARADDATERAPRDADGGVWLDKRKNELAQELLWQEGENRKRQRERQAKGKQERLNLQKKKARTDEGALALQTSSTDRAGPSGTSSRSSNVSAANPAPMNADEPPARRSSAHRERSEEPDPKAKGKGAQKKRKD
jgi:hypothetical protein